jgi:hypothetical protein
MQAAEHRKLWQERVQQWRDSGLSQRAFALRQGWPTRQTNYWIRKLSGGVTGAAPGLLPVSIKRGHIDEPVPAITLHAGGWRVDIAAGHSAAWLADLLRRLA